MRADLLQPAVRSSVRSGCVAACLLAAAGAAAAESVSPAQPEPGPAVSIDAPATPEPLPSRRGGAAPQLPEPQRTVPPATELSLPATSPPAAAAGQPLEQAPRFVLRGIRIEGNTVLDQASIDAIAAPYLGKPVSLGDLEDIRRRLTLLYVQRGYLNSGAIIPNQDVGAGVVTIRVVEGTVTDVEVAGTNTFNPDYFRSRLASALRQPFNVQDVETEQQILLQDPLVKRLNIDLLPGIVPGEARLHADVLEGSPFSLTAQIADDQSPTVGEVRGQLQGAVRNILGYGDVFSAEYGRSQGLNDGSVSYSVPLRSDDTRLNLRYDINGTLVVNPSLAPLDITSRYSSISAGLSRPFYRTAESNLTLGANLDVRKAQTFLLGSPFPFTAGSDANGNTNVTALRFYQDWLERDAEHAFAVRSTFSFGIDALGATVVNPPPVGSPSITGNFFDWLGQAQYVRRIYRDWDAVVRSDLQLSSRPLFPIEQFALGGIDTVRGYREYLTVTDDAFFASGELRIPIGKVRLPHLADADDSGTVQIVPFYDYGRGWNLNRPTPPPAEISSVGLGLRWQIGSGITLEVYYGKALRHVPVGTSLEDRGIDFRLTTALY
jgi:hemolysin activation/secretion protein